MRLIPRLTARLDTLRSERGFSMIIVVGVMAASSLFVAAAFSAANGDLPLTRDSQDRKQAYAAAEAGINFYQYHLNQDPDYWTKCISVPAPNGTELNPVNQIWNGSGADPRRWRKVPGSGVEYAIELMPANGNAQCTVGNQATMIQASTGGFRIRSTGRPRKASGLRRTLVATFRRRSFLDFLYFTDFETVDPLAYTAAEQGRAASECADKYRAGRTSWCDEIQFSDVDAINGPMHTNDDILTCGTPIFGRNSSDTIEFTGPEPGWKGVGGSGCGGVPVFKGPVRANVKKLTMPSTNATIQANAQTGYLFTGTTKIRFNPSPSNNMTVTTNYRPSTNTGDTPVNKALPPNGVIYVKTGTGCGTLIPPISATYTEPASCGNLYVSGTYTSSVTLAAQNDIIIKPDTTTATSANLTKPAGSDHVLGLIANNFVRVYHRVSSDCDDNLSPVLSDVSIDAAILSLAHSFVVDNWRCGNRLDDLTVNGAIAQKYRGAVGTTAPSGYDKVYNYDDRLRYRSPPFFLEPIAASWGVVRSNEQVPATG